MTILLNSKFILRWFFAYERDLLWLGVLLTGKYAVNSATNAILISCFFSSPSRVSNGNERYLKFTCGIKSCSDSLGRECYQVKQLWWSCILLFYKQIEYLDCTYGGLLNICIAKNIWHDRWSSPGINRSIYFPVGCTHEYLAHFLNHGKRDN